MIIAVIQARMTSTRFPGKVLVPLQGKALLWHTVFALQKSQKIQKVVLAISQNLEDDELVSFANDLGIDYVRGDELNVLERFIKAYQRYQPEILVRVTGDCPIIDTEFLDSTIEQIQDSSADYVAANQICIHEGVTAVSARAFDLIIQEKDDPTAQEHVTSYIQKCPEKFKIVKIDIPVLFQRTVRLSVDTPQDLDFLQAIYDYSGKVAGDLSISDLIQVLDNHPELLDINSNVQQKSLLEKTKTAWFLALDDDEGVDWDQVISKANQLRQAQRYGIRLVVNPEKFPDHLKSEQMKIVPFSGLDQLIQDIQKDPYFDALYGASEEIKNLLSEHGVSYQDILVGSDE